jgi:serine/threonine protein kinase
MKIGVEKLSIVSSLREKFKFIKFEEGFDLLERLLELDPTKRISAKEAYLHPFATRGSQDSHDKAISSKKAIEVRIRELKDSNDTKLDSVFYYHE